MTTETRQPSTLFCGLASVFVSPALALQKETSFNNNLHIEPLTSWQWKTQYPFWSYWQYFQFLFESW